MEYPEGTTHLRFVDIYKGHWEYWKQTEDTWFYFDLFMFEWEEATPAPWQMPTSIKEKSE